MPDLMNIPSNTAFNARILTTFGKLDAEDIEGIDGCTDRLVTQLMDRYGWSAAYTQTRIDGFCTDLSEATACSDIGAEQ